MISFANNHIVNKVRFALQDKSDTTYSFEDKLQIIQDALAEYNKAIFSIKTVDLSPTNNTEYILPQDYKGTFKVRVKPLVYGAFMKSTNYVNTYLDENVDFIITEGKIKLINPLHYATLEDINAISTLEVIYEYTQDSLYFENLSVGYTLGSNKSILVADSSKYDIGEYIMFKGTTEQVVTVKSIPDSTHIVVDLLSNTASGDSIIGNIKIPSEDINIVLHYTRYINEIQASNNVTQESWGQGGRNYSVSYKTFSSDSTKGVLGEFYNMLEKHPNYRNKVFKGISIFNNVKE